MTRRTFGHAAEGAAAGGSSEGALPSLEQVEKLLGEEGVMQMTDE